jgi:hypothetical protein
MPEPKIQIEDHVLTEAQAMAVRVAITSFADELVWEDKRKELGPIADAYHARLHEVLEIIFHYQPLMRTASR